MTTAVAELETIGVGPAIEELEWFAAAARPAEVRSMARFAEDVLRFRPGSPRPGRFRLSTQPFTRLWFAALASGQWRKFNALGPSQSSKSIVGSVTPAMYHLFERGETIVYAAPNMDILTDKWRLVLEPAIANSCYRQLLPRMGRGSKGGLPVSLQFANGTTLRFMTGGGGEKSRSDFTARVLIIAEADGFDVLSEVSAEGTKLEQLRARIRGYGEAAVEYSECTVSTETGHTWRTHQEGTGTRIALPCPYCGQFVTPEREHLVGWKDAGNVVEARRNSAFACPACGERWTEAQRYAANLAGVLVHRGQTVDADGVHGEPPATDTFSLRWTPVNNFLRTAGDVGVDEWKAKRAADSDAAERSVCQFVWAVPPPSLLQDVVPLEAQQIAKRGMGVGRGIVPADTEYLTLGIDPGKWYMHWIMVAWRAGGTGHVVDYNKIIVESRQYGVATALLTALHELEAVALAGWPVQDSRERRVPDQVWIDARFQGEIGGDAIYAFVRQTRQHHGKDLFRPALGFGASQTYNRWYRQPRQTGRQVRFVGEQYHGVHLPSARLIAMQIDVDHWKTWVHQRLSTPLEEPGALALFASLNKHEHDKLAKHLLAEVPQIIFVPGKGEMRTWRRVYKQNHWLDAIVLAAVAGHFCGVRIVSEPQPVAEIVPYVAAVPDDRPWYERRR